jgi:hypothetical protein
MLAISTTSNMCSGENMGNAFGLIGVDVPII